MRRFGAFCPRLFLILFLCSTLAAAQVGKAMPGEIIGQVRLKGDVAAPFGAMVLLERPDSGLVAQTNTDSQGKFQFRGLEQMTYALTVRMRGYETYQTQVDLTLMSHSYLQIMLKPLPAFQQKAPPQGAVISARDSQIPPAAVAEFEKGKRLLMENSDAGKSIPHFVKAIHLCNKFPQAYLLMGMAYIAKKQWKDADSALQKTIELDSASTAAYIALGELQFQQRDYPAAEKSLLKAVTLDPDSAEAHFELGRTYWAMGRWQDADPHAAKARQLKPDNAAAHVLMGNILLRKRDAEGALREFKEALGFDPQGPMAEPTRQMIDKIEAALQQAENQKK